MDHLPAQEAKHVINLLSGLFLYAYRTKNKKAKVTMDNMEHLCHVGSTILFRNEQASRRLIEQYLRLHPQLPKEDAACIARFQGCRKQQLYVMQYEQEYTFVMDRKGKTLYGVKGITDSLSFLLRNQTLPCMVQYAILPYKNHFILDSIGNTQAIAGKEGGAFLRLSESFKRYIVECRSGSEKQLSGAGAYRMESKLWQR